MITPPVPLEPTVFASMSSRVIVAGHESGTQRDSLVDDHRCAECGYGVSVYRSLPRCPMCGGQVWLAGRGRSSGVVSV
jgi:DNA-directed RNA polymerase subunit RPC12/RpoP